MKNIWFWEMDLLAKLEHSYQFWKCISLGKSKSYIPIKLDKTLPFLKIKYFSWKKFFLNNILIKMAVFQTQSFGVDRRVKKHNSPCYFKPWGIKMELEKIRFRWMIFYQWFWIHHELSKERNQLGSNIGWFVKMVYVDIFRIKISTYCAEWTKCW
jgi:hypothetical protein